MNLQTKATNTVDERTKRILRLRPDPRKDTGLVGARSSEFLADKSMYKTPGRLVLATLLYKLRNDLFNLAYSPMISLLCEDQRRRLIIAGYEDEADDFKTMFYQVLINAENIQTKKGPKHEFFTIAAPRLYNPVSKEAYTWAELQALNSGDITYEVPDLELIQGEEYLENLRELNLAVDRELYYIWH